jgi:type II secretion system protein N
MEELADILPSNESTNPSGNVASKGRFGMIAGSLGWASLAVFFFILFTLIKMPDQKIKAYILGSINAGLSTMDLNLTAKESSLKLGFGIEYEIRAATLYTASGQSVAIDKLNFSPTLWQLFLGRLAARIETLGPAGNLVLSGSVPIWDLNAMDGLKIDFTTKKLDAGKLGILTSLTGLTGSVLLDGSGAITGSPLNPSAFGGEIKFKLSQLVIDQQMLSAFQLPRLGVSESNADLKIEKGKITVRSFQVGSGKTSSDDRINDWNDRASKVFC